MICLEPCPCRGHRSPGLVAAFSRVAKRLVGVLYEADERLRFLSVSCAQSNG